MSITKCLLLAIGVLFISTSCLTNPDETSGSTRQIIYGLANDIRGIDPHINHEFETGIILRQLYDTLIYRHPETREFVPGLADSWQISEDELRYTFSLKQNVTFHDGTTFNAEAVARNLDRIFSAETGSPETRESFGPFIQYQVLDASTIQLILAEPFAPFLDVLSQPFAGIASPTALNDYSYLRYQYHQVGTGPFRLVEYLPGNRVTIERNPDYIWGPDFYNPLTSDMVQRIEFRFFRDPSQRLEAIETGDSQIMTELTPADARSLVGNSNIRILPVELPGTSLMFSFNVNQAPTDNLAVRQALIYAANRTTMADNAYQGFLDVAWGPLAANALFYTRQVVNAYPYDIIASEQLLDQTGYIDTNGDGLRDIGGGAVELKVIVPPWRELPRFAELLREQWESLGINVVLDPVPGETILQQTVAQNDYNLVPIDSWGLDPAFLGDLFASTSDSNWSGYANTELDNALRQASVQSDSELRRQLYGQIQILLVNEALVLPLGNQVNINAHHIDIGNLTFDATGWYPLLHNVTIVNDEPQLSGN